jgi:hypothetical protein
VNTVRAGRCGNYYGRDMKTVKAELVDGNCWRQVTLLGRPRSHFSNNRFRREAIIHDGIVQGSVFSKQTVPTAIMLSCSWRA